MKEMHEDRAICDENQIRNNSVLEELQSDPLSFIANAGSNRTTNLPPDVRLGVFQDEESNHGEMDEETVPLTPQGPLLEDYPSPSSDRRQVVRSRSSSSANNDNAKRKRQGVKRNRRIAPIESPRGAPWVRTCLLWFCRNTRAVQSTISCMNLLARLLFWTSILASILGVFWYSYELYNHGTEPHLIAWFSAGAFVLLGFPISMYGIVTHLANYNQPDTQMYVVRILWMVPIYSIESWLAMRFHKQAIYIETLRDFYESYVLYSFLQFLIQVLGGEEALVLMLKDKSPTRGYHMWGLQWFIKPWIMGQPIRKSSFTQSNEDRKNGRKTIRWVSPFFMRCKLGVLQYVLLKFLCAVSVLLLEWKGLYQDGNFAWHYGYLYICIITNLSQCWALYCLILFYFATKNELAAIRPVGKFMSVKALVFFTWWQSVMIAIFDQAGMIPEQLVNVEQDWTTEDVAKGFQDYLICIEMFIAAVVHSFVFPHTEYSPDAVTARLQASQGYHSAMATTGRGFKRIRRRLGRSKFHPAHYERPYKDGVSRISGAHSGSMMELASLDSSSRHTLEMVDDSILWHSFQPQEVYDGKKFAGDQAEFSFKDIDPLETDHGVERKADALNYQWSIIPDITEYSDDEENALDETSIGDETEYVESDSHDSPIVHHKHGFVRALLESAIPSDLGSSTMGIVKGDYHVEKKTLLHVAAASDQYDLFNNLRRITPKDDAPMK